MVYGSDISLAANMTVVVTTRVVEGPVCDERNVRVVVPALHFTGTATFQCRAGRILLTVF